MKFFFPLVALAISVSAASAQDAPIVQPGAPGEPAKRITREEAEALSATSYIPADARFMQHMIVHHGQAVEMVALIADRTSHEGVTRMGARISASQATEIEFMKAWLVARGESTEMQGDHPMGDHPKGGHPDGAHPKMKMAMKGDRNTPLMVGMLSPAQMDALAASTGAEFDRLFLTGMIHHHQGAIDMVNALLTNPNAGEDPALSEFLSAIIADQSAEILRMQNMLAAL